MTYKETPSNRIGRFLPNFTQHKVYTTLTNRTHIYCNLWKTTMVFRSQPCTASDVNMEDRQVDHRREVQGSHKETLFQAN